jgi:hypothetical protein
MNAHCIMHIYVGVPFQLLYLKVVTNEKQRGSGRWQMIDLLPRYLATVSLATTFLTPLVSNWSLPLNLKLSSGLLSHFSHICGASGVVMFLGAKPKG